MKRLEIVSIIIIIGCILVSLTLYHILRTSKEIRMPIEIKRQYCNVFSNEEKNLCLELQEICQASPESDKIQCIARYLAQNSSKESAWKMCQLKEEKNSQFYCMANALVDISLDDALAECDKMNGNIRYICRADQKERKLGTDEGLSECNNIKDLDDFHFCRALIYSRVKKEDAKKECEMIQNESPRNTCFTLLS
jgi:hypothetical protein